MDEYGVIDETVEMEQSPELGAAPNEQAEEERPSEDRRKLVARILSEIKADKKHHGGAFTNMRRDMNYAMRGHDEDWHEDNYKANICGRHVRQKVAALYAKNPKAVARRRDTLDFAVWDENPQSLMLAQESLMQMQEQMQAAPPEMMPQIMEAAQTALETIQDATQGMERRRMIKKIGRTLEILFHYFMTEQKPLDFKRAMKALVRRACTTGVGYVELGFQREMGPRPGRDAGLQDMHARLTHLEFLLTQAAEGEIEEYDAEMAELKASIAAIESEEDVVLREGLVLDFPQSTRVIPDRMTKQLDGFVGARHISIEYTYSVDEVKEIFGVDIGKDYSGYTALGDEDKGERQPDFFDDDDSSMRIAEKRRQGYVCVWKMYDKTSGLVYYVADGYHDFLQDPAAPDIYVEDFWPIYALTFNAVEHERELFPPSDVALIIDMQKEHNRSRQGQREHRQAARPKWAYAKGMLEEQDALALARLKPLEAIGLNLDPSARISDVLQAIPIPGVDPNLYETNQFFTDMQLSVGTQQAMLGGLAKATATESSISASASASGDEASIDELDAFLTTIARASGQVLLREMTQEQVMEIVGPGAVWPDLDAQGIAEELFLEVEAGSTGKPNQAVEINNMERMLPFLLQIPGIEPTWLAKEVLRRLDDRLDLTEAVAAAMPSIVMQNRMAQPAPGDPQSDPQAQGPEGGANGPAPPGGPAGSNAAFGSNQV